MIFRMLTVAMKVLQSGFHYDYDRTVGIPS